MSVVTASYYPSVTAAVVSGSKWLPPSLPTTTPRISESSDTLLRIEVPEFDLYLATTLTGLKINADYGIVIIEALIDPDVSVLLTLKNQVADDAGNLQIKEVSINFDVIEHRPRAHFLAASLYAMFSLAGPVNIVIPEMGISIGANFSMSLPKISELLQGRQTYYGLMVIERAISLRFEVPEHISGDDMNAISFTYHAIMERTFDWVAKFIAPLPLPANEDSLTWLNNLPSERDGRFRVQITVRPGPNFTHNLRADHTARASNDIH